MIRTQIYITSEQDKFLRDLAYNNNITKSDVIRKAIDLYRDRLRTKEEKK